ncbi:hypothetical protein BT63DRAFT_369504 [Microthyrium microscopicum]|uniref:Uncharacterized protein n=1 Tax=Microthyrium microscopicum TaxID=703497 RepID=A0A6A6UL88_9PEZI|nr:hypothetical protein BT63DRAFT_369504 [Microthyrium microscopicum]
MKPKLTDIQRYRVTSINTASTNGTFDFERCAALHNHVIERGWLGTGRDLETLERRSWWDFYGQEAERIRYVLAQPVVEFLQRVILCPEEDDWSWHYFLACVTDPETILDAINDELQEVEGRRFLWLYLYGMPLGHTNGLIFDQVKNLAIIQPTIEDEGTTSNGRQKWLPLEVILDAYIDMIDKGKIVIASGLVEGEYRVESPWTLLPYSNHDLQSSLGAFQDLVDAISARLPHPTVDSTEPLANASTMAAVKLQVFAKEFFLKAKRPSFKFIAPGIAIQSEDELRNQPYMNVPLEDEEEWHPVLLFRAHETVRNFGPIFGRGYEDVEEYPSGLYLSPYDERHHMIFADGVKLVLPFKLGQKGFARSSDGELIGGPRECQNEPEPESHHDMLYTQGYNPFIEYHDIQLYRVLKNWTQMVVDGHWQVNAEGVGGGIEKFRDADSEEHGDRFVITQSW